MDEACKYAFSSLAVFIADYFVYYIILYDMHNTIKEGVLLLLKLAPGILIF